MCFLRKIGHLNKLTILLKLWKHETQAKLADTKLENNLKYKSFEIFVPRVC